MELASIPPRTRLELLVFQYLFYGNDTHPKLFMIVLA